MKRAKPVLLILGAAAAVVVIGVGVLGFLFQYTGNNTTDYYGCIDNELVEKITPHGGMNYRYRLPVYLEDGSREDLDLDTSRVLKDGAYIRIVVAPLRGVLRWEELQYEELPAAVQAKYPQ